MWLISVAVGAVVVDVDSLRDQVNAGAAIEAVAEEWCASRGPACVAEVACALEPTADFVKKHVRTLLESGAYGAAESALRRVNAFDQDLWTLLGLALYGSRKPRQAAIALGRGSGHDVTRARALQESGDADRALAIVQDRDDFESLLLRAEILAELGQDARSSFESALQLRPDSANAWRQLGLYMLDFRDDKAFSEAPLERALDADPADLGARHGLERARQLPYDIRYVTFASDPEACGLLRLVDSARHFGLDVRVLGERLINWANGDKVRLLRDFAAAQKPDTLVFAVDGYDVMFAAGDYLDAKAHTLARPGTVFVSADQTFYFRGPDEACYGSHYPHAGPYRFLNSGALVAAASDLVDLLSFALDTAHHWDGASDQTLLHRIYVEQRSLAQSGNMSVCSQFDDAAALLALPTVVLDNAQVLFGNTGGRGHLHDFDIIDGRLHNNRSDTFPAVLHCPGGMRFRTEFARLASLGWAVHLRHCAPNEEER